MTVSNFFELLGLPTRFDLPADELARNYRELQARVHPDKFASASEAERRASMQMATDVNEAYRTLKSPLKRATYLVERQGVDLGVESNTAMPTEFLMAQLEWREALEEAEDADDMPALESLAAQLRAETRRYYATVQTQIDTEKNYAAAATTVRELMFLEKLLTEIDEAIEGLED